MHSGLPYRPPAGGWPGARPAYKGCYQHTRAAEQHIQHYDNVTATVDSSLVAPRLYNPWHSDDFTACGTGVEFDVNCYALHDGLFDNLSRCRKLGFKNAQAAVVWHGMFPYTSYDPNGNAREDSIPHLPICSYDPPAPTASTTKYLTLDAKASMEVILYDKTYNGDGSFAGYSSTATSDDTDFDQVSVSVNKRSGIKSQTRTKSSGPNRPTCTDLLSKASSGAGWPAYLLELWMNKYVDLSALASGNPAYSLVYTLDSSDGMAYTATLSDTTPGTPTPTVAKAEVSVSAGTLHFQAWSAYTVYDGLGGSSQVAFKSDDETYAITDTKMVYKSTSYVAGDYLQKTIQYVGAPSGEGADMLSNPYTASQVESDLEDLLNLWPLNDDVLYPWRTDDYVTTAPLVMYNGYPYGRTPDPETSSTDPYVDPNTPGLTDSGTGKLIGSQYDGSILGGPNPAGFDRHFDWRFESKPGDCAGATYYGAMSPAVLPTNATHWPNECQAAGGWPGAFMAYGPLKDGSGNAIGLGQSVLWGQKWAQIKIHRPAINFARPFGADRFAVVNDTCGCISAFDGTTVTLAAGVSGISTGDLCLCNALGAVGVFPVTRVDDSHYTLGALKWSLPASPPDNVQFGKIRWPGAWAIEGRITLASATGSGTLSLVLVDDATYLRAGDVVDLVDASDAPLAGYTSLTVTAGVDAKHWTVSAASPPPSPCYIKSHGAPHYWWFDSDSKGDFIVLEWQHDFRDIGEADRLCKQYARMNGYPCSPFIPPDPGGCNTDPSTGAALRVQQQANGMQRSVKVFNVYHEALKFDPCWPQVVCISPNGETFTNGVTLGFTNPGCDERYGSLWQCMPLMVIEDPFYSPPVRPCDSAGPWGPDTIGDCSGGQYSYPPLVEARDTVPSPWVGGDSAPTLPGDVTIHILTLAELAGVSPTGILQDCPQPVGSTGRVPTDWTVWFSEFSCVCTDGAFAEDYKKNEVTGKCP